MADVNRGNRPLSPHVSVYRWPLNAILSIFHRITGSALAVSGVLIVWWFLAAATSPAYFETVTEIPDQMANTVAEVEPEAPSRQDHDQSAEPGGQKSVHGFEIGR